jgi:hypothetical protein
MEIWVCVRTAYWTGVVWDWDYNRGRSYVPTGNGDGYVGFGLCEVEWAWVTSTIYSIFT